MQREIPSSLLNPENEPVFGFLRDRSAHSDVSEVLLKAIKPLSDVQVFCPDPSTYRYVIVSTVNKIFGFAIGSNLVAFRLDPPFNERALSTGGEAIPELGAQWVGFQVFRSDWPEPDLKFWARRAYVCAREK